MKTCLVILLSWFLLAAPLWGHRQKMAYINIEFNPRSGLAEISHRFNLHDAEHITDSLFGSSKGIIGDKKTQSAFVSYMTSKFQLKDGQGKDINLFLVGHEVEGSHIWIYQEFKPGSKLGKLQVKANALQERWPKHLNQVNVKWQKPVKTVRFRSTDTWKTVTIAEASSH